jgi:hypothetical protein
MSLFCIILKDNENSEEKRTKSLDAHLNYLRALKHDQKLISAGPLMTSTATNAEPCGSVLVVNFENEQAVKDWLSEEPFNQAGVYQKTEIYPYLEFIDHL